MGSTPPLKARHKVTGGYAKRRQTLTWGTIYCLYCGHPSTKASRLSLGFYAPLYEDLPPSYYFLLRIVQKNQVWAKAVAIPISRKAELDIIVFITLHVKYIADDIKTSTGESKATSLNL